ncbi:DNA polymerase epsilon subunit 3 [Anopheles ziemanni]|uniref:DNA polymerase epsilon subunit 3 n=1 Tax=Anopheles coustani TaxID=139045 RepID=UPI00265A3C2F|nr:DNA polymerase epsilon subunit 3 [Anopheles coustani]XP_058175569.1 DNA polymerase epsilon subunit 3 [Anopheles ziemanni]
MVERIEDLNLPNTSVTRLMKEAIPADVKISTECRTALTRATSVFVLYLTSAATTAAQQRNHKSLMADHVLKGLEEIEFESFIQPLKTELESYRKMIKTKKEKKAAKAELNTTVEGAVIDLENMAQDN